MINIGICDDSADYLEIISMRIQRCLSEMEIDADISLFSSIEELESGIGRMKIDILFLDIMFGEVSSIDWCIKRLVPANIQIVFMTDYPIEAYNISEVEHAFYLIKARLSDDLLRKSLTRVISALSHKSSKLTVVRTKTQSHTIDLESVTHIESMNNHIIIHFIDKKNLIVHRTLKSFCEGLTPNFLRCHKSYIVNMNFITTVRSHDFILKSNEKVPIPPKKYNEIVGKYMRYVTEI